MQLAPETQRHEEHYVVPWFSFPHRLTFHLGAGARMGTGALVNTRGFPVAHVNASGKIGLKIAVLGPLQKGSGGRSVKKLGTLAPPSGPSGVCSGGMMTRLPPHMHLQALSAHDYSAQALLE